MPVVEIPIVEEQQQFDLDQMDEVRKAPIWILRTPDKPARHIFYNAQLHDLIFRGLVIHPSFDSAASFRLTNVPNKPVLVTYDEAAEIALAQPDVLALMFFYRNELFNYRFLR